MTGTRATAAVAGSTLLERAISYTLGTLALVTPAALDRPTPCADWDLRALLDHLDDSLLALAEALEDGRVPLGCPAREPTGDRLAGLRRRAGRLLGASAAPGGPDRVDVGGRPLTRGILTGTGAIEVAVHGWDVARACGTDRPIPDALAADLLDLAPLLVTAADRPGRFAPPVPVPPRAAPADRLLAYLGRYP